MVYSFYIPLTFTSTLYLSHHFESLINSYIISKIGIQDHFIPPELASSLRYNLQNLFSRNKFHLGGTGNDIIDDSKVFRGDSIHWLDRKHEDTFENMFFDLIDAFVLYLNEYCYAGIKSYEFHYTLYPVGSFYKKHLDQFRNNDSRQFSMIIYLNADWHKNDGGELKVYKDSKSHLISPTSGKLVFFKSSELEHEVLITNKERISITGWLKS